MRMLTTRHLSSRLKRTSRSVSCANASGRTFSATSRPASYRGHGKPRPCRRCQWRRPLHSGRDNYQNTEPAVAWFSGRGDRGPEASHFTHDGRHVQRRSGPIVLAVSGPRCRSPAPVALCTAAERRRRSNPSGPAIERYFVGTRRFSSSNQCCTKIIWVGGRLVVASFLSVSKNRRPSGATS